MAHVQKRSYKSRRTGKTSTSWQARYTAPDGRERTKRFERKVDAESWLATEVADVARGAWVDPELGKETVRSFANRWLAQRRDLAVRTAELYRHLLDRHILPTLGDVPVGRLSTSTVRAWHGRLAGAHPTTAAKAYRLLATIMSAAVDDRAIAQTPCRVKRAAEERSPERPVATVAEVQALADAMPKNLRIAVLLAAWCHLRRGELLGLRRRDVDLLHGKLIIRVTRTKTMAGSVVEKAPKTEAGRRTVAVPPNVVPDLQTHMNEHVGRHSDSPVLAGAKTGEPVLTGVLHGAWTRARAKVGRTDLHLHDLRHSGLTWAAAKGATIAELMRRAGHKSPAAALRYQHATDDRDAAVAAAMAELATPAEVVPLRSDGQTTDEVGSSAG